MSLPNFMCIGAAKSGTTTLYDILKQHPEIFLPAFKEPHFFDIAENYNNGIEWYERNYFNNINQNIIADFTPSYFFEKEAPKRIFNNLGGGVKFIVILRHPVERAYSHYLHSVRDKNEDLSFEEAILKEDSRIEKFIENGDYLSYLRNSYYHQGLYGAMIERYLKYFSLDNFLFIHFENEFKADRKKIIDKLLVFIGAKTEIDLNLDLLSNPASRNRSVFLKKLIRKKGWWKKVLKFMIPYIQIRQIIRNKVQRANLKEFQQEKLSEKLKTDLYNEYFKEDIIKFEKLTNKKLSW